MKNVLGDERLSFLFSLWRLVRRYGGAFGTCVCHFSQVIKFGNGSVSLFSQSFLSISVAAAAKNTDCISSCMEWLAGSRGTEEITIMSRKNEMQYFMGLLVIINNVMA